MTHTLSEKIGNVIRIIDNRTVIINAGKPLLSVGDKIKIYEELDPLYDLDGSLLCTFEHTKDTLEVIEAEAKYSVCQKKETTTARMHSFALSPLLELAEATYVPLNVDDKDIQPLEVKNPKVSIGDPVKLA